MKNEKIKGNKFPPKLITSVPDSLKDQFDNLQLKQSLYRLKNLAIVLTVFRLISLVSYLISGGDIIDGNRLAQLLYSGGPKAYFPLSFIQLAINSIFIILASYLYRKDKRLISWLICYSFILFNFCINTITISTVKYDIQILFFFFITIVYNVVIPNMKPRIFLLAALLYYFATMGAMIYNISFSRGEDTLLFVLLVFLIIVIIKIIFYNSNVKIFIEMREIEKLNEKLAALSITDELTKLNNRRSFLEYMDIIWKQSQRLKLPLSIMMIDIDFFKKYNDSMGHLEGDNVLVAVAQCMKNQLKRDTDFIARFGGEEFVCLLPYIEKVKATQFAEELVKSIENLKINHPMNENSKYVTISAGMASIIPDDNTSQKELLDEADKALYTAKKTGRNRVVVI